MDKALAAQKTVVCDTETNYSRFFIFSLIGFLFFLTPIKWDGVWTIGIGILANYLKSFISAYLHAIATIIVSISALGTILTKYLKRNSTRKPLSPGMLYLFDVSIPWFILRIIGAVFILMIYFQVGPDWVISKATGGTILHDLNPVLIPFFFFAILLMPFLTDYGFMEYIGTLLSKIFQKLFKLPGRAAVDASASWLGSAAVGVLITNLQYEKGKYNLREAAIIATSFSLASAAFCLLITEFIGLPNKFPQFYTTVTVVSLIAAVIMARIPPLSRKPTTYLIEHEEKMDESRIEGMSLHQSALYRGAKCAANAKSLAYSLTTSLKILADIYLGLMPVVFALGTIVLAISEYTPLFTWLAAPIVPFLELLRIPEAAAAAPAMVVGFADMFLPAVLGKGIENELTRFVIACISVTQVIYMTEVGSLILKSSIKVSLLELIWIFLVRTIITLPIIAFIVHVFVY